MKKTLAGIILTCLSVTMFSQTNTSINTNKIELKASNHLYDTIRDANSFEAKTLENNTYKIKETENEFFMKLDSTDKQYLMDKIDEIDEEIPKTVNNYTSILCDVLNKNNRRNPISINDLIDQKDNNYELIYVSVKKVKNMNIFVFQYSINGEQNRITYAERDVKIADTLIEELKEIRNKKKKY